MSGWKIDESGVQVFGEGHPLGGRVVLLFTGLPAGEVRREMDELGAGRVTAAVRGRLPGHPAVTRLRNLVGQQGEAGREVRRLERQAERHALERAEAVDAGGPGLAGRVLDLDRRAADVGGRLAEARAAVAALAPLVEQARAQAVAAAEGLRRQATAEASAAAGALRSEVLAGLPALLGDSLTTLSACGMMIFLAALSSGLGTAAETLLDEALAAGPPAHGPAEAEADARPGAAVAVG